MAKITEKRLYAVTPQALSADGDATGKITIANTSLFVVGHIVIIKSNTQPPQQLKIKRIISPTEMYVGLDNAPIHSRISTALFLVADGATIEASEQQRPSIPEQEIERNTYDEEPTVARRVIPVDQWGQKYTTENPFPVQLSDGDINIGSVNAELEVQLSHMNNVPDVGDVADSVRIGDGVEELAINPDGSINVVASIGGATNPLIQNIPVALADTQYVATLPTGSKKFILRCRSGNARIQFCFVSGQTNTNFFTINPGVVYGEDGLITGAPRPIYFELSKPSQVIELLSWS